MPWPQSRRLAKAWAAATGDGDVTLRLIKGAGHVDQVFYDQEHVDDVLDRLAGRAAEVAAGAAADHDADAPGVVRVSAIRSASLSYISSDLAWS